LWKRPSISIGSTMSAWSVSLKEECTSVSSTSRISVLRPRSALVCGRSKGWLFERSICYDADVYWWGAYGAAVLLAYRASSPRFTYVKRPIPFTSLVTPIFVKKFKLTVSLLLLLFDLSCRLKTFFWIFLIIIVTRIDWNCKCVKNLLFIILRYGSSPLVLDLFCLCGWRLLRSCLLDLLILILLLGFKIWHLQN
jgi:hypothetical protein